MKVGDRVRVMVAGRFCSLVGKVVHVGRNAISVRLDGDGFDRGFKRRELEVVP